MTTAADVAVERRDRAVVVHLSGEIDMTNAGYVGDELGRAVTGDASALVVNLTGARYLDSAAIELLFDLSRRLRRRRQELRIVLPEGSPLRRVLELTEVGSAAPVHPSLEAAVADL